MSVEQNKALVRRYLDAVSGRDKPAEVVERFVADRALREHIAQMEAAFPRYRLDVQDLIGEGDRVAVRFVAHVVHQGVFMNLPPTGRHASFGGIVVYRIADGRIAEHWLQVDASALVQQLTAPEVVPVVPS